MCGFRKRTEIPPTEGISLYSFLLYGDIIDTDISRSIQTVCSRIRTLEIEFHTLHPFGIDFPIIPCRDRVNLLVTVTISAKRRV